MPRVFDCVILAHWGELGLLEKRFQAHEDNPDVTHVICEGAIDPEGNPKGMFFVDSELAARYRGRWNHVRAEAHEITGDTREQREESLRGYLSHGVNGNDPDDRVMFSDIRDIPEPLG